MLISPRGGSAAGVGVGVGGEQGGGAAPPSTGALWQLVLASPQRGAAPREGAAPPQSPAAAPSGGLQSPLAGLDGELLALARAALETGLSDAETAVLLEAAMAAGGGVRFTAASPTPSRSRKAPNLFDIAGGALDAADDPAPSRRLDLDGAATQPPVVPTVQPVVPPMPLGGGGRPLPSLAAFPGLFGSSRR